ncbi:MAG: gluconate 2-dehydrogenase subunit 3 family protein, partial [Bacteroidia bacterium]|nr:gluconate 2-dehydrogenase subunit 3 family protein [Bacteroidia bacterium]
RREAIKNLGLSFGYALATPSVISLLQSCKTNVNNWEPLFFSVDEGVVIRNLVDLMLPKTELTAGALEVNVPEFLDLYASKIYTKEQQDSYKEEIQAIIQELLISDDQVSKLSNVDYDNLLKKYLKADANTQKTFKNGKGENIVFSSLLKLRNTSVWAYKTSELIGESVLAYDPVPGRQQGCISVNEATGGKAWSL